MRAFRHFILLAIILLGCAITANAQIKVVDSTNGNIVMLAQIQDAKGHLLGFTTKEGLLPNDVKAAEGISIQHMAYEPHVLSAADIESKTVLLTPRTFNVDEVVIKGAKQDYVYLRGYYRKYGTENWLDTLKQSYAEGMLEYVIKNSDWAFGKKPRILSADVYELDMYGDSICKTYHKFNDEDGKYQRLQQLMAADGITPLAGYCYLLFVLLYFPCLATIVAIKSETGSWRWALVAACYTTVVAWIVSAAVFQIGSLF